eukprot:TRINITY_DN10665_c0_g1_i1.p1 TRINITY_DN10665_c0_g1~~TRINITY_DN10665_c0_g1_i1.p1  ORF type:complete len:144 (+),score=10.99 TRINITY_DN10665_c0_g1_i1:19-450(+)
MSLYLGSTGADVRLWDVQNLGSTIELSHQFSPHTQTRPTVPCIRFNHNNRCVVSGGADGKLVLTVLLPDRNNRFQSTVLTADQNITATTESHCWYSLSLTGGSRYLCAGGDQGLLNIWDLKTKKNGTCFKGSSIDECGDGCLI